MKTYIALLRGINVGGNNKVSMADLKAMLEKLGFENVKTLLNSGNAIFETDKKFTELTELLEKSFEKNFNFFSKMFIIPVEEIQELIESNPFRNIDLNKFNRLYITFLTDKPTSKLKIPYSSKKGEFTILKVTDKLVVSALEHSPKVKSTEMVKVMDEEFGKNITTRNWNTVLKLISK